MRSGRGPKAAPPPHEPAGQRPIATLMSDALLLRRQILAHPLGAGAHRFLPFIPVGGADLTVVGRHELKRLQRAQRLHSTC